MVSGHPVDDLFEHLPLADMNSLEALLLSGTAIADLAPLQGDEDLEGYLAEWHQIRWHAYEGNRRRMTAGAPGRG